MPWGIIYRSKEVPWRIKCRRLVDHVYSVFSFGSDNWSWTSLTKDKIKRWETKMMMRLFRFKRVKEETWVEFRTRCCKEARKIWIKMGLPLSVQLLLKACGELWDGCVIRDPMLASLP